MSRTKNQKKPRGGLSRAFLTGLATLLPTVLTILILTIAYNFLDEKIAGPLNNLIHKGLSSQLAKDHFWGGVLNYPEWQLDEEIDGSGAPERADDLPFSQFVEEIAPQWLGFLLALLLVFAVGIIFRGYLGRQLLKLIESFIRQVPLIKIIYPYAKQVTEFFFEEKNQIEYETAVAVEYPRKGIWSLGFVTSSGFKTVSEFTGEEMVSIFIPSSPTPITGYTILVSRESIIQLDLSVEEVLRFTISGGVILPPNQLPDGAKTTVQISPSVETGPEEEDEGVGKP
ncbi:MAG TPA: DUF502 domain-containing protein [Planctomycetes bacterium]|nr:DUF502 domain-containing protein [Planctomycetota bacterium]HIK82622.1 DUF502 domain-containing protein [Planctomycetota bacterium]